MNPASSDWPLLSPSSSFLIRAPLTSDDLSSGSEIDLDSHSDSASEDSEVEPEPVFKPVARLTGDDDVVDSGEESFDDVDGDGFVVRVRIPNPDLNPSFDDYEANNASESEVVLDVDGDGLLSATVVNSNFDPGNDVNVLTSSSEESFETVDGDGFSVRAKRELGLDVGLGQDVNLGEHVGVKDANLNNLIGSHDDLFGQNGNGENFEESEVEGHSSQKSDIVFNVEVEESGKERDNPNLENNDLVQYNLGDNLFADEKIKGNTNEVNLDETFSVQDSNDMDHSLHLEDDFVGQKSQNDSPNASFNAEDIFRNYGRLGSMEFSVLNSSSGENYSAEEYLGDSEADGFAVDSASSHSGGRRIYYDTNNVGKEGQNDPNCTYENVQESDDSDAEMIIKDRFSSASTVYDVLDNDDSLSANVQDLSLNGSVEIKGSSVNGNEIIKDSIGDKSSGICALDDEKAEIFSDDLKDKIFVANEDLKAKYLESKYYKIADIGDDENIIDKEVETGAVFVQEFGSSTFCDKMNVNYEARSQAVELHKDGIEEACNHKDMGAVSTEEIENDIAGSYQKYELVHGDGSISLIPEENSAIDTIKAVSNQKHEPDEEFAGIPNLTMLEEDNRLVEKVEALKVKFLRVIYKLGFSPQDTVPASVLHRLSLIVGTKYSVNTFEGIRDKAIDLENEEKDNLNFSCNILIIGKAGVGKSATLNSIFEDEKSPTNTFETATSSVRIIEGFIDGVRIRVLDTPGLGHCLMDQTSNIKILSSVKRHMKKYPVDAVLYVDRLDMQTIPSNDLPLLKSITDTLGQSIWTNAIITLTHAGEAPPDDSNGMPLSYEEYVNRRSCVIQLLIRQMVGDISSIKPVVLVENDLYCRMNKVGQNVLPNESVWKPELLLLCCSSNILSEANSLNLLNPEKNNRETSLQKLLRSFRTPPIQFFLTSVLQSKNHPKLSPNHNDINFDAVSDGESEKDEYDHLPKFCPLTKSQIAKLSKEHKRAYFEEYDYRVKLLQKIQMKEEIRRLKEFSKRKHSEENSEEALTAITPATQEIQLPPSFDSENPVYRYRSLDQASQFCTGYFLDPECFDHDYGFDGVSLQYPVTAAKRFPAELILRLRKDKKNFSIDSLICAKHGKCNSSLASLDVKTIRDQVAYLLKTETKFKNLNNKSETTVGIFSTFLDDILAPGVKLENKVMVGEKLKFDINTGATCVENDIAYGANVQSDLLIGRNTKMNISVGMSSNMQGQVVVKLCESEQLGLVHFLGFVSVALSFFRRVWLRK